MLTDIEAVLDRGFSPLKRKLKRKKGKQIKASIINRVMTIILQSISLNEIPSVIPDQLTSPVNMEFMSNKNNKMSINGDVDGLQNTVSIINEEINTHAINDNYLRCEDEYEVLYILGHRFHKEYNIRELKIQWKGYKETTFEPEFNLYRNCGLLLRQYNEFVKKYGNPLNNKDMENKVKDWLSPSIQGRSNSQKPTKRTSAIVEWISDTGLIKNTRFVEHYFDNLSKNGLYDNNFGVQWFVISCL